MFDRAAPLAAFALDPEVLHWNHGSFGACARAVLAAQAEARAHLEAAPMRYFVAEHEAAMAAVRTSLGRFLGADPDGLALVTNASTAVATALAALPLAPGDEVVTTDHAYRACRNQLDRRVAAAGARVVVAPIALPVRDPRAPVAAIVDRVGPRTRAILCDHVTSPTAIVLDVAAVIRAVPPTVAVIVDGAHAPGMVPLALDHLGATWYAGNLHKWTCAPKGAGFLWVAPAARAHTAPLVASHGATAPLAAGATRFRAEHDWTGTADPTAHLAVPTALATVATLGGGWPAIYARGRALARAAAGALAERLGGAGLVLDDHAAEAAGGAMAALAVALPDGATPAAIERALLARGVEVPIVDHPASPWPLVRLSAHLYNCLADVEPLADHLRDLGVRGHPLP